MGAECKQSASNRRVVAIAAACAVWLGACGGGSDSNTDHPEAVSAPAASDEPVLPSTTSTTATPAITGLPITIPDWLFTRTLATDETGFAPPQETPPELVDRKLPPRDVLALPTTYDFHASVQAFDGEPLDRSTWHNDCPVHHRDLRYVTVTYWGFDERPHQGELVVHADVALDVVGVFQEIYESRFPIEEMRIVRPDELTALPTGDTNNSASFVCRDVVGGTKFSQHAYGLAIDINPFHNPYIKGNIVLPELATAYTDRSLELDGMLDAQSTAVVAFIELGWGWGGNWNSLKDYQHFSRNGR